MIALKDNLGSEFVERVRGFFSEKDPLRAPYAGVRFLEPPKHTFVQKSSGKNVGFALGAVCGQEFYALKKGGGLYFSG